MTVHYQKKRVDVLQTSRNNKGENIYLIQDVTCKRLVNQSKISKPEVEDNIDVGKAYEYFGMEAPDDN